MLQPMEVYRGLFLYTPSQQYTKINIFLLLKQNLINFFLNNLF